MSCDCKNEQSDNLNYENDGIKKDKKESMNYLLRFIIFLITLPFIPFAMLFFTWLLFKIVVLNKTLNLKSLVNFMRNKIISEEDEDDYIFNTMDYNDLELLNVDDITNKQS